MDSLDERTYHGTLNRLVIANTKVGEALRWCTGYPQTKNMERLNQLIPLTEVEKVTVRQAIVLLEEVVENG